MAKVKLKPNVLTTRVRTIRPECIECPGCGGSAEWTHSKPKSGGRYWKWFTCYSCRVTFRRDARRVVSLSL